MAMYASYFSYFGFYGFTFFKDKACFGLVKSVGM